MEIDLLEFFLHLDRHLDAVISQYGFWTYAILFVIIFCETGLVVTPFLPGDSLLFAAGALAATTVLDPLPLFLLLSLAAIGGNTTNYWIGYILGPGILSREKVKFIRRDYLERTHRFYEKHGGKTIVIARFLPIIRTFAPFVAGIGYMTYWRFMLYNVTAGLLWVGLFVFGGYFFGNVPLVKRNFPFVILAIVVISVLPMVWEYFRHRVRRKNDQLLSKEE